MKIIYYVNPEKRPDGQFKCVVCGNIYADYAKTRRCAQADHRKRRKQREELAAALEAAAKQPRKRKRNDASNY